MPLRSPCRCEYHGRMRDIGLLNVQMFWVHLSVHAWSWRFAVAKSWAMHSWWFIMQGEQGQSTNGEKYTHYIRSNIRIHANHIREYPSQSWNRFSSPRTVQDVLSKKAAGCKESPWRIIVPKIYKSRSRDRRKNQSIASFPEYIN